MFDWLVDTFTSYPYLGAAVVFLLCGLGLPLPEELVLIAAGYVCFKDLADLQWMILSCAGAILLGDLVPFLLGRIFGSRLLRLRPLRILVTKRRLAKFDQWFRRRGDLVIFFARFLTGVRIVAYFTAGTMNMSIRRFITLDLIGIAVLVPLLVGVGYSSGSIIDDAIARVQEVERGILIGAGIGAALLLAWYLLRRQQKRQGGSSPRETYVTPPVERTPDASPEPQPAEPPESESP